MFVHAGCERAQDVGVDASQGRHNDAIEQVPERAPCARHGTACEAVALLQEQLRDDERHDHWCQRCF